MKGTPNNDNLIAFKIILSEPSTNPISVAFEALSGTAAVTSDFDIADDTLIIPAGETTAHIFVRTVAESVVEDDETVILELTNPTNGVFAGGAATLQATGTILDDDTPAPAAGTPRLIVQDSSVTEGGVAEFTLIRLGQTTDVTSGSFTVLSGTADVGVDFAAVSGTFSFAIGQNVTTISVPVNNDAVVEGTETFVLELSDIENGVLPGLADEAYAIGTISDAPGSSPPVAVDDSGVGFETNEDTVFTTASVLANDTDVDAGDVLSVSAFDTTGTVGRVTNNGDGTFDYDPNGAFEALGAGDSTTDSFSYTVSDGNDGSDTATVTITVNGVNDDPVAADDTDATAENTAVDINVLANDTDVEGDTLTVASVGTASNGTTAINPNGTIRYTPDAGFSGTDSFSYIVSDGNDGTDTATVTVNVEANLSPSLTIVGGEVLEGDSNNDNLIIYTVMLSEAALTPVTFEYRSRSGTADEDSSAGDFDTAEGTVTIASGDTTAQFSVRTLAESLEEADESVLVDIFNVEGAVLANGEERATVLGIILDDDGTGLKRAAFVNDVTIVEGDGGSTQAVFEIRLSRPSDEAITLNFETRDGTALAGSDYNATSGSVTFAAGQTVQSVSVDVLGDTAIEGGEQFSLVVAPTAGDADELAVDFAGGIATIVDDDASTSEPSLTIVGGEVLEGDSNNDNLIIYTVMLSEAALTPVTFEYRSRSGTADEDSSAGDFDTAEGTVTIASGDTTAQFSVRTLAESLEEADESVLVDIFNVEGAVLANGEERATVLGIILDDDGTGLKRAAFVNDVTIVEGDGGSTQAVFEIRLSRPSDEAITLNFETRDGTALAGSDYNATSGSVTFAAGQTVQSVSVDVLGDTAIEGGEQFSLVVAPTAGDADELAVDFAGGIATIVDDDASTSEPSLTIVGGEVLEGDSNNDNLIIYTVMLSEAALTPVTFEYRSRSGTADEDSSAGDFDTAEGTVTIASGDTTAQFSVRTLAESLEEADESVLVDIFNVEGAVLANGEERATVLGIILDDDGTGLKRAAFVNDVTIVEGDGGSTQAVFEIRLSRPSDEAISFNYTTVQRSADSDSDFTGVSSAATGTPLVFAPGQTVASIAVDVSPDTTSEAAEDFQLVLTTTSNQIEGGRTGSIGTATILDDDSGFGLFPEIAISGAEILEGDSNNDNLIAFKIILSEPSTNPISVAFEALSGTAAVTSDFDIADDTLIIPAGETTAHIFVRTVAESVVEDDETVILELTNPTNGVFAGGAATLQATGTILDDDTPAPAAGTPRLIVQDSSVTEGGVAEFTLIRLGQTTDVTSGSFTVLSGTADVGVDFAAVSGTFSFAIGQNVTTISVPVNNDAVVEGTETFVLELSDIENGVLPGLADEAYAIGTISDAPGSSPPVAVDDSGVGFETNEDTVFTTASVLANDTDVDAGDVLSVSAFDTTGTVGRVTNNGDGTFDYDPNGAFEALGAGDSTTDSFSYTVSDGNDGSDTATVTITVNGVNDDPVAADDTDATAENTAVDINVLANDTDVEGDTLTVASVGTASNGTTAINPNGTIRYTPDAGFSGTDSFSYIVSDGNDGTDTATVTVNVEANLSPSLTIVGGEVLEGDSNNDNLIIYTVMLSEAALTPVTFEYRSRSGTADEDSSAGDFDTAEGTVTIASGDTTAQFSVRTLAESLEEADESVLVDIFNVEGAVLANGEERATVLGIILDDDGTGLKRAAFVNDVTIVEGDGGSTQAVFEIRLSRPSDEAITLNFETRDGTALAGSDYNATSGSVTFAAGQTVQSVSVDVLGDTAIEGGEQFSLVVAPTAGDADELAVDFAGGIATIVDDDASTSEPSLTIVGGEVLEGDSNNDNLIIYTVMLSEAALTPVTFEYRSRSGTADEDSSAGDFDTAEGTVTIASGDTTAQFSVRTLAESLEEADESVLVDIFNVEGAVLANGEERATVLGIILDDDGTGLKRAAFVNDVTIVEGDGGSTQAVFEIRLSRPSDEAITLNFETRDGTALAGSDYNATSGSVTFAAGQTVQSVSVDVLGDTAIEGGEQFSLVVAPTAGDADELAVDFAGGIATIVDDDASTSEPSLTIVGGEVLEGDSNNDNLIIYTVMLSEAALTPVTFEYRSRSGTADEDSSAGDFDTAEGTVTIASGDTTAQFSVRTLAESLEEADESVLVDIFNVEGAVLANGEERATVLGIILDDDGTGLKRAAFVNDVTIVEGDGGSTQAVFEIRLSRPSDEAISFNYTTVQRSADSDSDFTGVSSAATGTPLVFAPGQTVASIAVDVSPDTTSEAAEDFQLVLTTTSNQIEGGRTGSIGTATILDDDSGFGLFPEIAISGAEILEGDSNNDNLIAFKIILSEPSTNPISVAFEALSGTAAVTSDFDIADDTLIIPAGETTAHIFVRTVAESVVEDDETVILELTNPTNGVFAGGAATLQATGTILDDDTPAPAAGTPRLIVQDSSVTEGGVAEFTLIRLGQTTDVTSGSFTVLSGTADVGVDFAAVSGTFSFAIGQNVTTISVPVNNDAVVEGTETFVLELSDIENGVLPGLADEAYAIGTISDAPGSSPPVAVDDSGVGFETNEDTVFTTASVLANDTDVDAGDVLSVSAFDTTGTVGRVTNNGDGTFDYDPNGAFEALGAGDSTTDSFSYTVSDGNDGSDTATVTITVNGVNDDPVAADDTDATAENTAVDINVLANDTDVEGDTLTVASVGTASNGTTAINPNGTIRYTPDAGFSGTDSFSYIVSDGNDGTDTATVTVNVSNVPQAPIVAAITAGFGEDATGRTVNLLDPAFVSDPDGDDLDVGNVVVTTADGRALNSSTDPETGLFTLGDGQFDDLAEGEEFEIAITYDVTDGDLSTPNTANTATVTIIGENDAPDVIAEADVAFDEDDDPILITQGDLVNPGVVEDVDTDLVDLFATALTCCFDVTIDGIATDFEPEIISTAAGPETVWEIAPGQFDFLAEGALLEFSATYLISDGIDAVENTVNVTITGENDAPVANDVDLGEVTDEDIAIQSVLSVSDLDDFATDVDSPLDFASFSLLSVEIDGVATDLAGAGLSFDPNTGVATLDPTAIDAYQDLGDGESATVEVFFTVTDGEFSDNGTVTFQVEGRDEPPVDGPNAVDDTAVVDESDEVTIDVLDNDEVTAGPLRLVAFGQGANGSVERDDNGTPDNLTDDRLTYRPDRSFEGPTDSFSYTVQDANGQPSDGQVTVTIIPNGDPEIVAPFEFTLTENTTTVGTVNANDPDGDALTFDILDGKDGTLFNIDDDGNLSFNEEPDFEAPAGDGTNTYTLDVVVVDPLDQKDMETITVTVENDSDDDPNRPPETIEFELVFGEDEEGREVELLDPAFVSDPDGDDLEAINVDVVPEDERNLDTGFDPETGVLTIADGQFDDLAEGEEFEIAITYDVTDGDLSTPNAAFVTIIGENDAPDVIAEADVAFDEDDDPILITQGDLVNPGVVEDVDNDLGDLFATALTCCFDVTIDGIATDFEPEIISTAAGPETVWEIAPGQFDFLAEGALLEFSATYLISDGIDAVENTVNVTITGENDAPVANDVDLGEVTDEDIAIQSVLSVSDLDDFATDVDSPLDFASFSLLSVEIDGVATDLAGAGLSFDPNTGVATLDPTAIDAYQDLGDGESATVEVFFTVTDGEFSDNGTVTFQVEGRDEPPVDGPNAVDDTAVVDESDEVTIDVLDNDEVTAGPLRLVAFGQGANGSVERDDNGTPDDLTDDRLTYTPDRGFEGPTDSFIYTVEDDNGQPSNGQVTVTIIPNGDPEIVAPFEFTLMENTTSVGTVSANDPDGDDLTFDILDVKDGTLFNIDNDGNLSFKAAPDFEAPAGGEGDSNTYTLDVVVVDLLNQKDMETITVTVENDPTDDPVDPIIIGGTPGSDVLVGTDANEIILSRGGALDFMTGGGGGDIFVYEGTADANGRELAFVTDYEIGLDQVDLNGRTVTFDFAVGNAVYMFLDGSDFDTLVVEGVSSINDIDFVFIDDTNVA